MQIRPSGGTRFRAARHPGFTLVELLVVIAIIGVLVSLLLPAVQAARATARRMQCINHLKQMALGGQVHHDAQKHFPTGGWGWAWVGDPDQGFGKGQPGGWVYNILPYIEQANLYERGKGENTSTKRALALELTLTPLATMNCPSRRPAKLFRKQWNPPNFVARNADDTPAGGHFAARTDYAANVGDPNTSGVPHQDGPGTLEQGLRPDHEFAVSIQNGVIYQISTVRFGDITDGTTNTIFLSEKYLNPDNYGSPEEEGLDPADNEGMYTGTNNDNSRITRDLPRADRPGVGNANIFGSAHPAGLHVALCDGSVRQVSYSVNIDVWRALGNREDGLSFSLDD